MSRDLPLRNSTVDVYYSGGVRRALRARGPRSPSGRRGESCVTHGVLLVSVPYLSPLRRVLAWLGRPLWHFVSDTRQTTGPPGSTFFQYAFTPGEFRTASGGRWFRSCRHAKVMPSSGAWGRSPASIGLSATVYSAVALVHTQPPWRQVASGRRVIRVARPTPSIAKRLLVAEDPTVPVAGVFVRLLCWAAANMMMYTCVLRDSSETLRCP